MQYLTNPLFLPARDYRFLFDKFGPSLGLWRAAEVAVLREAVAPGEETILDLGCGDGLVTSCVYARVAIGLDPDRIALDKAAGLNVYERRIAQPMETAGLPENSLDTVISNSVLEHVTYIDHVLECIARVLKPGGRLVFTCPSEAFSGWLALPGGGYAARRNRHFEHYNLWPLAEWQRRLERAGLRVECVRPYLRRGWVRAWDTVELMQRVYIGKTRLFGKAWRAMPPAWLDALARRAAQIDLSAPEPGGGRMIVARKG